ncbi:MAG: hypothetical protein K940chlam2_01466, partial [Chlamydiae bacterium]|nr:hypothetical protein [Chlamydiota bacterium]
FGIIILNWNGKADTLKCLASIPAGADVVVVDNGSHDGYVDALRQGFSEITILETAENLGSARGTNAGIAHGLKKGWDTFLILNNDTTVDAKLVTELQKAMESNPKVGILGAKILRMEDPTRFDHLGGIWNGQKGSFDLVAEGALDEGFDEMMELDYVCGAAICVRRAVFEEVGSFEPNFFLFWEESDLCYRARKSRWEVRLCPEAKILHKGSASFIGGKPHTTYFYWRGRLLWLHRNLSPEQIKLQLQEIGREWRRLVKRRFLKSIHLTLAALFDRTSLPRKKAELRQTRAALHGMRDFFRGRFGPGPAWIYKK